VGRVEGKVVIITGGGRGQGAAEAELLAREGAAVAVCDVLEDEGRSVARAINEAGGAARFFPMDVKDDAHWQAVVEEVLRWKGRITTLVNNAGIINRMGIVETSLDNWHRVIDVNLLGPFLGMKRCAPVMREAGGGSIVNVSSIAAYLGLKCTGAMEFVDWKVRVNAICPGTIVTGLNAGTPHLEPMRKAAPMKRHGTCEEIAQLVLFLASDESSYITGVDIPIDGGIIAAGAMHGIALEPSKDALAAAGARG
jgi:NAD(P)-dependent dehydrogenase (short-subunit alcohol dehydrogenase family)